MPWGGVLCPILGGRDGKLGPMLALGTWASWAPMAVGDGYEVFMGPEYRECSDPWGEFGRSMTKAGWTWAWPGCCWSAMLGAPPWLFSIPPMPIAAEDGDCDISQANEGWTESDSRAQGWLL
jgi:hypothetical protein